VARTVNVEARALRREAFVDAGLRLIQNRGYEQMSVQDVLDELEASRGAFYHYFESKHALLEAAVDRLVDAAMAAVAPVAADPELPAAEKLERLFSGIAGWKTERKDLMLALLEVWYSDDNAIVRDKLRRSMVTSLTPPLAEIIRQGGVERAFTATSPDDAARAVVSLLQGAQDLAGDLFFARRAGTVTFEFAAARLAGYMEAIERIVGAPAGSVAMIDDRLLRSWFG